MGAARRLDGRVAIGEAARFFCGQSGAGKTGLAHHIARELDRELIVHTASDLLSKWVGDTEQRIAEMFYRAAERADEVVLLLDEADTFLKERSSASTSREQRSEEHTYELQSLMRTSYAVFCLKKKNTH